MKTNFINFCLVVWIYSYYFVFCNINDKCEYEIPRVKSMISLQKTWIHDFDSAWTYVGYLILSIFLLIKQGFEMFSVYA